MNGGAAEHVLVVEDDHALRTLLADELAAAGYRLTAVASAEAALDEIKRGFFSAAVSDIRLPGEDGLSLLRQAQKTNVAPIFIMISAYGTIPQAVEALKLGAEDYLTKPVDVEYLVFRVGRALHTRRLEEDLRRYREILRERGLHGIVGKSAPMRAMFERLRRIAAASGPVLVQGESGVGKELVAQAVHRVSPRHAGPFVAINCAGIPGELLESELFGHVSGAFSGAIRSRNGLFKEADGGTLLLDEIAEMPGPMQAKLLRVLEDGRIRPIGSDQEQSVDVRVIAATNRPLEPLISEGSFREDLFYRLETFRLQVPPLRDREEDIELLALHFVERFGAAMNREVKGIDHNALGCLRAWPFPGNVRELANAMEHAVTFCDEDQVRERHLPDRMRGQASFAGERTDDSGLLVPGEPLPTLSLIEQRYVRHVLERVDNNKQKAARVLGIGRRTLYRRLAEDD